MDVTLTALADGIVEPPETAVVTIIASPSYGVAPAPATVTIYSAE